MADIAAALDRFVAAFNTNDLDLVMEHFAEDAEYLPGDGSRHVGLTAIRREFEPQFRGAYGAMTFDEHDRIIDAAARKATIRWTCRHDIRGRRSPAPLLGLATRWWPFSAPDLAGKAWMSFTLTCTARSSASTRTPTTYFRESAANSASRRVGPLLPPATRQRGVARNARYAARPTISARSVADHRVSGLSINRMAPSLIARRVSTSGGKTKSTSRTCHRCSRGRMTSQICVRICARPCEIASARTGSDCAAAMICHEAGRAATSPSRAANPSTNICSTEPVRWGGRIARRLASASRVSRSSSCVSTSFRPL